jgi:hypothetical protein
MGSGKWIGARPYLSGQSHASGDEKTGVGDAGGHHAIFLGLDEAVELVDLDLDAGLIFVLRLVSVACQLLTWGFEER